MNIEQLQYITMIAKTGSISVAAEKLHVSQAGISKAVARLEEELGIRLFQRSRLGSEMTERGRMIAEKAGEVLAKLEELREEARYQSDQIKGEVRFSVGPNFMSIISRSIISFKKDYPHVRLAITSKNSEDIVQDLKEHRTDLGLIYFDNHGEDSLRDLTMHKMLDSSIQVYVSRKSPLANQPTVSPRDLLDQAFVNADNNYSNWYIQDFEAKYGLINIIFTSNNIEILKQTIAEGVAIGIFIEFSMRNDPLVKSGDLVAIPLVEHQPSSISLGWARLTNKHFSTAQREFLKYLIREYHNFM